MNESLNGKWSYRSFRHEPIVLKNGQIEGNPELATSWSPPGVSEVATGETGEVMETLTFAPGVALKDSGKIIPATDKDPASVELTGEGLTSVNKIKGFFIPGSDHVVGTIMCAWPPATDLTAEVQRMIQARTPVRRFNVLLIAALACGLNVVHADDGLGLKRGGNGNDVSISGVSAGAAMAVQYAVAHSSTIVGVGSIAGPGWGCAEDHLSTAINDCMCTRHRPHSEIALARELDQEGRIDKLTSTRPKALTHSYVFHSNRDGTVKEQSGQVSISFLTAFIGRQPVVDWGNATDVSNKAGHGIISPEGTDSCAADGKETTYIRRCRVEDNAGKLFLALFGQGAAYDPSKRLTHIPESDVWAFDQQRLVDEVKKGKSLIASDKLLFGIWPSHTDRRNNFDLASTGYLYVPPSCRLANSNCRIHVALHGCKQDAKTFATQAGYNNWAEHYKVILIYPAVEPATNTVPEEVCETPPVLPVADLSSVEPNPNGCWDWWGYLDTGIPKYRYLTKEAPQMQVIERIIATAVK